MCFQQAFSKKVTVVIDCFEVLIDRPANLLARAQTFSSYKNLNTKKYGLGLPHKEPFPLYLKHGEVERQKNI